MKNLRNGQKKSAKQEIEMPTTQDWRELCERLNHCGNSIWSLIHKNGAVIGVKKISDIQKAKLMLTGYKVGIYA